MNRRPLKELRRRERLIEGYGLTRLPKPKDLLALVALYLIVAVFSWLTCWVLGALPLVYWSVSKDACVECVDCACDDLPDKYERLYVE